MASHFNPRTKENPGTITHQGLYNSTNGETVYQINKRGTGCRKELRCHQCFISAAHIHIFCIVLNKWMPNHFLDVNNIQNDSALTTSKRHVLWIRQYPLFAYFLYKNHACSYINQCLTPIINIIIITDNLSHNSDVFISSQLWVYISQFWKKVWIVRHKLINLINKVKIARYELTIVWNNVRTASLHHAIARKKTAITLFYFFISGRNGFHSYWYSTSSKQSWGQIALGRS